MLPVPTKTVVNEGIPIPSLDRYLASIGVECQRVSRRQEDQERRRMHQNRYLFGRPEACLVQQF
jgi:hypothetical protein